MTTTRTTEPREPTFLEQTHALEATAGIRVREDLRVLRVRGDDRVTWLSGQITGDVRKLAPQEGVHALAINVRGKIMAELWVVDAGDHLVVILPASAQAIVTESFERYIIMEDVLLEPDPDTRIVSVQGPLAEQVIALVKEAEARSFRADELHRGGRFVFTTAADAAKLAALLTQEAQALGARAVASDGVELARLRAGVPAFGVDYDESSYPQEAGLKALLSFDKGCYLGQEVVCTLENRGRLHRRLCSLVAGPGASAKRGDALESEPGQLTGALTSVVHDPESGHVLAFGYVKRAHALAGHELRSGETRWTVRFAVGEHDSTTSGA